MRIKILVVVLLLLSINLYAQDTRWQNPRRWYNKLGTPILSIVDSGLSIEADLLARQITIRTITLDFMPDPNMSIIFIQEWQRPIGEVFGVLLPGNVFVSRELFDILIAKTEPVMIAFLWKDRTGRKSVASEIIFEGLGNYYLR